MLKDHLRSCRIRRGYSQTEMAAKLNISRQAYNHYETGRREPDYDTLFSLSQILNVSVDYLLGREEEKKLANYGELDEDMLKISELVSSLDEVRLDAALEFAQKISTLDDDEVKAILTVIRGMEKK